MAIASRQTPKQQFVSLLQAILRDVKDLDDMSFEGFLAGDLKIGVVRRAEARSAKSATTCSEEQVARLKESLGKITAREQARDLIGNALRTRRDMKHFARCLDIPIPNRASSEEMMNRLVEGTVGYRLRSAAIREREPGPHSVDRVEPPAEVCSGVRITE